MASEHKYYLVNSQGESSPATISSYFKIFTPSKTDIWRPSPDQDDFNAPFIYTSIRSSSFKQVSVTVSADWKTQFDQGGLLITWPAPGEKKQNKWIKIGIEYFNNVPLLGIVGCDRFSDWSVCPMPISTATHATFEAERVDQTLWIYLVFNGGEEAFEEVKWAFLEEREAEAEMWVGTYAAKPTPEQDPEVGIEVIFRDFKLETVGLVDQKQ